VGSAEQERATRRDDLRGVAVADVPRTVDGSTSAEDRHDVACPQWNVNVTKATRRLVTVTKSTPRGPLNARFGGT